MPKKSFWSEKSRYGTYEGERGSPDQWASSFGHSFENSESVKAIFGMDAYTTLGLTPSASDREIQLAYRRLARVHHPDKGGNQVEFQKITDAYNMVKSLRNRTQPVRQTQETQETHETESPEEEEP